MDRPFLKIAANDKYDHMVGIQITDRKFTTFYPGKKEPIVLYNGSEPYCKIYGTYDISYVGHNYTFEDAPLILHDYDYIEFEFKSKKITNENMFLPDFIDIISSYIRYYWEIDVINSLE